MKLKRIVSLLSLSWAAFMQPLVLADDHATDLAAVVANGVAADSAVGEPAVQRSLMFMLGLALEKNPEIMMALQREQQAHFSMKQARAYRYPSLEFTGTYGPEYNDPSSTSAIDPNITRDVAPGRNSSLSLLKLLYDGGTSKYELRRREEVTNASALETRIVAEDIVSDLVEAYTDVLRFQRDNTDAQQFVVEMQSLTDTLETMFDAGAASKVELDFARSRLASARAETGEVRASLNDAFSNLEFLTGPIDDFIAIEPLRIESTALLPMEDYVTQGMQGNADIMLNQSNQTAARHRIRAENGKRMPTVEFEIRSETLADEGGQLDTRYTHEAKFNVNYLLFDGFNRKFARDGAKARLTELEYEKDMLKKQVKRRISRAYNQVTANQITLAAAGDEVKANKELQRLNRKNLEKGNINIIELIDVEERLYNAQSNRHRLNAEIYQNYYELLLASGLLKDQVALQ